MPIHEKNQLFKYGAFCFGQKKLLHNGIMSIFFCCKILLFYKHIVHTLSKIYVKIKYKNSLARTVDRSNIFKYEIIRNNRRQRIK